MARSPLRIGVLGATGALGSEVVARLESSPLRSAELRPFATEASLGSDVELAGRAYPVRSDPPTLHGLDLVFLCAPAAVSLDFARQALRAEVPAIDCSGALAGAAEVPLAVAALPHPDGLRAAPLVSAAGGAALALALVLRPLQARATVRRVLATVLEGAAVGGRRGMAALQEESLALFAQQEAPAPAAFGRAVAFDCLPAPAGAEAIGDDGHGGRERDLVRCLSRLLGGEVAIGAALVQVPVFAGLGVHLVVETEPALDPKQIAELLAAAPGVALVDEPAGPTLRDAAGREEILVGRVRADLSGAGAALWLAADPLRLSAANAVRLAEARLLPLLPQ